MPKIDSSLNFSENSYDLSPKQSIYIFHVTDSNDKNFQFQFRSLQDKSKKIDFKKLKDYLKTNTTTLFTKKKNLAVSRV